MKCVKHGMRCAFQFKDCNPITEGALSDDPRVLSDDPRVRLATRINEHIKLTGQLDEAGVFRTLFQLVLGAIDDHDDDYLSCDPRVESAVSFAAYMDSGVRPYGIPFQDDAVARHVHCLIQLVLDAIHDREVTE